jgi:tetratricopeptide (TPR) repeat protein
VLKALNTHLKFFICLFLCLTTLAVFWPVKNHEFIIYDDGGFVTENPRVQAGLTVEGVKFAITSMDTGNWHPMTWLSHMLDCQLFGLNAGWHHLTNVFFHTTNTLLLFLILTRMTHAPYRGAFVAGVFALHPLHVESVAWVAERKDVLSTFFWMLTMGAYVKYVERPGIIKYLSVLMAFALGLMAKPMLVTLPFVLFLMDFWPLKRFPKRPPIGAIVTENQIGRRPGETCPSLRGLIYEKVPLMALTIPVSIITVVAQRKFSVLYPLKSLSLDWRVANALVSYVWYIWKMFIPLNLSVFYPHPGIWPIWQVAFSGFFFGLICVAIWKWGRRYPYLPMGWLWYLGTLLPVIGLVQVGGQAMADRYTYIPLTGLFIIIAWGAADIFKLSRNRRMILGLLALITLIGSITITGNQLSHWQNSITLFKHAIAITPLNHFTRYALGIALMDRGNYEEAISQFQKAIALRPDIVAIHNNYGVALTLKGELARASNEFEVALKLNPDAAAVHNNLAMILSQQGNLEASVFHFREALRVQPEYANAHYFLAVALEKQGKVAEAESHYTKAIQINPAYANMRFKMKGYYKNGVIQ